MEMVLSNGFCEMEQNEMLKVDGGDVNIAKAVGNMVIGFAIGGVGADLYSSFIIGQMDATLELKERGLK